MTHEVRGHCVVETNVIAVRPSSWRVEVAAKDTC